MAPPEIWSGRQVVIPVLVTGWVRHSRSYKALYLIRRQLTESAVRAPDRRALFVGIEACEATSGVVMHDLFQHDDGGWLQDPALLDRLVTGKF